MRLHRFIGNYNLSKDKVFITEKAVVDQIRKVLRYKAGSKLILSDGQGKEVICEIADFGKNLVKCNIIDELTRKKDYDKKVTLFCSVLRKKNFELAAQKACEIGVNQIVPIIADHTVKLNLKFERLARILKEASEQAGRTIVPKVTDIMKFGDACEFSRDLDKNVLFDDSGDSFSSFTGSKSTGVWIGPEGGWSDRELKKAKKAKFEILKLGRLTLRAETAAIVASFIALNL